MLGYEFQIGPTTSIYADEGRKEWGNVAGVAAGPGNRRSSLTLLRP